MVQPQQPLSYHLTMSLILLFLTVYPYLFTNTGYKVAAYSAEDLYLRHNSIAHFDIIDSEQIILSRPISIRSTKDQQLLHKTQKEKSSVLRDGAGIAIDNKQQQEHEATRRIQFSSLGQRYSLVLSQPTHLITDDFTLTTLDANNTATKVPFDRNDLLVLEGYVDGETGSRALAALSKEDRLMTAQISTASETIIIEPTYLHKDQLYRSPTPSDGRSSASSEHISHANSINSNKSDLYDKTMIVYKLRDHNQFQTEGATGNRAAFNLTQLCGAVKLNETATPSGGNTSNILEDRIKLYEPSKLLSHRDKRGIDFLLEQSSSSDKTRCTLHLVADYRFYKHVGNGDLQTTINYLLALINRVNQIYLPTNWLVGDDELDTFKNIGFIVQNITVHQDYTRISSGEDHYNMQSDRLWHAREFLNNFSRNSSPKHYCLAHLLTYRQFDSPVLGLAYVASHRSNTIGGICNAVQQRDDASYRHNTGISTTQGIYGETLITRQADLVLAHELGHNLGAEHDSDKCRPSPAEGGAYLMHPYSVMGFEKNNRFLSSCSRRAIGHVIRRKAKSCFIPARDDICGNGIVEAGEDCDGGDVGLDHTDPCCDSSCKFTPGSQCSDRHSWCCSQCRISPAGRPCRPAEEFNCKDASYCDGRQAECPASPPLEDEKPCVGRGLCRGGSCIPFCEARGLMSCLCNTPSNACKLCCKTSLNGTCVPFNNQAPHLPDGVLCYRGVCEKGRCEQPIQDFIERLWDVIEDINFTTFVKFLRDNIILVVLLASIPVWCVIAHYINEFDKRVRQDVIAALVKTRRKEPPSRSPFLPRLFVGDEVGSTTSFDHSESKNEALEPLKRPHHLDANQDALLTNNGNRFFPPPHEPEIGFRPPNPGFRLPPGEEVVVEPRGSIAMNSIELPYADEGAQMRGSSVEPADNNNLDNPGSNDINSRNLYSTQV